MLQPDARIVVPPFVEQPDGEDIIIANEARSVFLAVPPEAVTLLRLLAEGRTVVEASAAYTRMYGVAPDIDDFIGSLTAEGFLDTPNVDAPRTRRYHFDHIPASVARRIWSWPVLTGCSLVVALGLLACLLDPTLVPSPSALVFDRDQVLLSVVLIALSLGAVFLHEMSHLLAARAAGVPARMGIGNRLWMLVAETEMTGIWLAPRRQRCLAFLAGMLFDLTLAAVLVLVLFADRRGWWFELDPKLLLLVRAMLFVQLTRLLWECYVFVPTDIYYVLGTLSGCRNLMRDTQAYLLNWCWRRLRREQRIDLSSVPPREMRAVRIFVWVWLAGRGLAFGTLFLITLPVLGAYVGMLGRSVTGNPEMLRPLVDGPGLPILAVLLQGAGIGLWLRGVIRARGQLP